MNNQPDIIYDRNVAILKDCGFKYRLTVNNVLRRKGSKTIKKTQPRERCSNKTKLDCNLSRAKSKVQELAYCNPWEYTVTLTIDQSKYDRADLKKYITDLNYFFRNYNRKYGINIKRLLVPELHKDGSWHFHGFFKGLPCEHLERNEYRQLDWKAYSEKFGHITINKVKNRLHQARYTSYMKKCINSSLDGCTTDLNAKMYYASQGLNRATEIKRGILGDAVRIDYDYKNDWVKIKNYDKSVPVEDIMDLIVEQPTLNEAEDSLDIKLEECYASFNNSVALNTAVSRHNRNHKRKYKNYIIKRLLIMIIRMHYSKTFEYEGTVISQSFQYIIMTNWLRIIIAGSLCKLDSS